MTPEQAAALVAALGVGTILPTIVNTIIKAISGKVGRERDAVAYERKLRYDAEDRLDKESAKRRKMQEFASQVIITAIQHGAKEHELPAWPEDNTMPRARIQQLRDQEKTEHDRE